MVAGVTGVMSPLLGGRDGVQQKEHLSSSQNTEVPLSTCSCGLLCCVNLGESFTSVDLSFLICHME